MRAKILKLQAQNKTLRETIRRLRKQKEEKKKRKTAPIEKEGNEHTTLRELGRKLLPTNFAKLLSAQIDAQIKSKRGRRYDPEFERICVVIIFFKSAEL